MAVAGEIRLKKWTREEWHRLIDLGVLTEDDRVELLDGDIVEMSAQSSLHSAVVRVVAQVLREAFGAGFVVSEEKPVALETLSEPEPDVSVARGGLRDFFKDHPADPVLIVEVALSSLVKDRHVKGSLYARAGRTDYWIVNLDEMLLEVYRDPVRDGRGHYDGWSYGSVLTLRKGDRASPLALDEVEIPVDDLLP